MNPALPKRAEVDTIMEKMCSLIKIKVKIGIERKGRAG